MIYKQTEEKYKGITLGEGTGSLYNYGCYLFSLVNGLNSKGYNLTPEGFNQALKSKNGFVGPYKNYIDVVNLHKYFPDNFISFQQIDPWNDVPPTKDLLKENLVVVCRVSAKPIGGTGDHFVRLVGIENGIAIIDDPWTGLTEKITNRWSKLGNILGLRIFEVKPIPVQIPNQTEKLPKDSVLRDIYTFLCGGYSEDEIKWRMDSQKNLREIGTDICKNDERFKKMWGSTSQSAETPQNASSDPVDITKSLNEALDEKNILLSSIYGIIWNKGFWWTKLNRIKELLPKK